MTGPSPDSIPSTCCYSGYCDWKWLSCSIRSPSSRRQCFGSHYCSWWAAFFIALFCTWKNFASLCWGFSWETCFAAPADTKQVGTWSSTKWTSSFYESHFCALGWLSFACVKLRCIGWCIASLSNQFAGCSACAAQKKFGCCSCYWGDKSVEKLLIDGAFSFLASVYLPAEADNCGH